MALAWTAPAREATELAATLTEHGGTSATGLGVRLQTLLARRFRQGLSVDTVAYILCVGLLLLPIWAHPYFVTLDAPMHLTNARLLLDRLRGVNLPLLNEYFVPYLTLFPYWFGHVALALLLTVFSAASAEKIYLTAYVALFALFLYAVVRRLNKEASFLSFLGLLLIFQRPLQMGFLSFIFSEALFLVLIWHWLKHTGSLSPSQTLVRAGFFLALYFTHATTFAFAVVAIGTLTIWAWACDNWPIFPLTRPCIQALGGRVAIFAVTVLLPCLLLLAYVLTTPSRLLESSTGYWRLLTNFLRQGGLALVSYREARVVIVVPTVFFVLALATLVYRIRSRTIVLADGFLVVCLLALGFQLYASRNIFGFYERMQTLPLLMLIFWFCGRSWHVWLKRAIPLFVVGVMVVLLFVRWPIYAQASANAEEVMTVLPALADGSTVLPLNYAQYGCAQNGRDITDVFFLFLHTPEYLGTTDKQLLMLANIGGLYPIFPYQWRPQMNPYRNMGPKDGIEGRPPNVDFASYHQRTGGKVDYVLTWCLDGRYEGHPAVQSVRRQLAEGYEQVAQSAHGQVVVYRRVAEGGHASTK